VKCGNPSRPILPRIVRYRVVGFGAAVGPKERAYLGTRSRLADGVDADELAVLQARGMI